MVLNRKKKIILAIIERMGNRVTAKCFQKYLFIFTRMQSENRIYDFVPYKYGCFSFSANQDIINLERKGFITVDRQPDEECTYEVAPLAKAYALLDLFDKKNIDAIRDLYLKMTQDELIAYTYIRWPFTAVNSVIKQRLLNAQQLDKVEEQRKRMIHTEPMLFTIGYEGFTLEAYLRRLMMMDVKVLVDVRKHAFSMKYGFSKHILQKACEGVGINYVHVPELGIETADRKELNTQADYDALFERYEQTTLKYNWGGLLKVKQILEHNRRVCLTCFEKDPGQCHRSCVAKALMALPDRSYEFDNILL